MASKIVFDLDGTLVDTREAVRLAYLEAGIVMPDHAWGLAWHEWLFDPAVHARKVEIYPRFVAELAVGLPLLQTALTHHVPVITGASRRAVQAVQIKFGPLNVVLAEASLRQKIEYLNWYGPSGGTYVDDNELARAEIERRTKWKTESPRSSLLPEPTPD